MRALPTGLDLAPRLLRLAMAMAMAMAMAVAVPGAAGCSHEATPVVQPVNEPPPLPPASGTPIGYLLEEPRLALTGEQRTKLKEIDDELAGRLANLDVAQRNAKAGTTPAEEAPRRAPPGFSATMSENGVRRGAKTATPATRDDGTEPPKLRKGLTSEEIAQNKEALQQVPELRTTNVRVAIARMMRLLDAQQQQIARKVLIERGVDPDTGKFEASGDPGMIPRDVAPKEVK